MELKGFITGSLVTLGVVGLVAALKEADVFDDDPLCLGDDDGCGADGDSEECQSDGTANLSAEKAANTAEELAQKLKNLESAAGDEGAEAVRAEIASLKASLDKLIKSLGKSDAA